MGEVNHYEQVACKQLFTEMLENCESCFAAEQFVDIS